MGEHIKEWDDTNVPLQIDENNLVTKVGHDMGGSYTYTETINGESYDKCVLCGVTTKHKTNTHIDYRTCYVEGIGQFCPSCFTGGTASGRELITIPKNFIKSYSNDAELGAKVRKYYYENHH